MIRQAEFPQGTFHNFYWTLHRTLIPWILRQSILLAGLFSHGILKK